MRFSGMDIFFMAEKTCKEKRKLNYVTGNGNLLHLISVRGKLYFAETASKTSSLDSWNATVAESTGTIISGQTRKLMAGEQTTWSSKSGTRHNYRGAK